MIAAHQQITDETGATSVMLSLEDVWHRRVLEKSRGEESVNATGDVSRL